jgi:hypothetical protein
LHLKEASVSRVIQAQGTGQWINGVD